MKPTIKPLNQYATPKAHHLSQRPHLERSAELLQNSDAHVQLGRSLVDGQVVHLHIMFELG